MENNENMTPEVNSNYNSDPVTEKKGFSIASLVLGILSICFFCIWYICVPCAILAIIFGIIGKKQSGKGMATAGFVLGIIAIAIVIIYVLFLGTFLAAIFDAASASALF